MIELTGITWDHPRGYAPLVAVSGEIERTHGIRVTWDKRSLKDFGDADVQTLARDYDLLVIDHPHVGEAADSGCLLPIDEVAPAESLAELEGQSAGPSYPSYRYNHRQWALPLDAACQVAAYRPDLLELSQMPATWEEAFALARRLREDGLWMGMALCPTDSLCSFLTLSAQMGDAPDVTRNWIQRETTISVLGKLAQLRDACHPGSMGWNPIALFDAMAGDESIACAPLAFGYINYTGDAFRKNRLGFTTPPGSAYSLLGGAGLAVSRRARHPDQAVNYALVACGSACQSTTYLENGGQPGNGIAWKLSSDDPANRLFLKPTRAALEQAYVRPRCPGWPAFQEALGERVHEILETDGDPGRLHDELESLYMELVVNHETL